MREQIEKLAEKRKALVASGRAILDKNPNGLNSEQRAEYDKVMDEVDSLKERIGDMERQMCAEREDEEKDEDEEREDTEEEETAEEEEPKEGERQYVVLADGRRAYLQSPVNRSMASGSKVTRHPMEDDITYRNRKRRNTPEYRAAFCRYLLNGGHIGEYRAIQADSDVVGGYLVAPQEFVGQLIKFVDNIVYMRQKATKFTVANAQSLGAPSLDTDIADSDWTSELATGNEDSDMAFGKRELTPHPLAKRIKVSNKLLRAAAITSVFSNTGGAVGGAEGLVRDRLGYKFAVTEEKGFFTGNGSQQPLGMFTASARGVSTGRDYQTGSTTGFTADGLVGALYNLKPQYQAKAEWFLHRDAVSKIRQLKDGIGQYLWQPGLQGGQPDTLLTRPVNQSEYVPNTFTTGLYVGMICDPSFYWICDAESMVIQRLVELYAEANQVGFIARLELDGMPVLEEAFSRLITN